MSKVVRNSKFRHVYGQAAKKQDCYDNIRITKASWDSTFCCVNPKFVSIITEAAGGGAFLVLPIEKVGRVDRDTPLVVGHKAAVLDIAWCPHNDNLIASASEDCTIKVWEIPNGGLTKNLTECVADLVAHQRRVGVISWHPSAHLVLLSAGADFKVFVWNVATAEILAEIDGHTDIIYSANWNYNGNRIVTTCRDKNIRLYDARSGELLREGRGHQAVKPMRAVFMKDGRIFTTGFSRTGERQYALWDQEKLANDQSALVMEELDSSNGVLFPFYDEDTNMIYLCGKGDSAMRYFEYTPDAPYIHYLNTYSSSDPQRGMGMMPKRGLNVAQCEISKFYKLHNSGLCEVITMTVPRKSELFQEDLYPDTTAEEPAITGEEWYSGKDADPILMSLRDVFMAGAKDGQKPVGASVLRASSRRVLDKTNRDSVVISNTDSGAQPVAPASMSRLNAGLAAKNDNTNGASLAPATAGFGIGQDSENTQHHTNGGNNHHVAQNGTNGKHTTNGDHQNGLDTLKSLVESLQEEVKALRDTVKKQDKRIQRLESDRIDAMEESN